MNELLMTGAWTIVGLLAAFGASVLIVHSTRGATSLIIAILSWSIDRMTALQLKVARSRAPFSTDEHEVIQ